MENKSSGLKWVIIGLTLLVICCLCVTSLGMIGAGTTLFFRAIKPTESEPGGSFTPTWPGIELPTAKPDVRPTQADSKPETEDLEGAQLTLQTLEQALVPNNDPVDLAERLKGVTDVPEMIDGQRPALNDVRTFWVTNIDTNIQSEIKARLVHITPHTYFWVQEGTRYDKGELQRLAESFENEIYPTNREFFGSEWTPGIDNDEHLYLLYASDLGVSLAGYFSSVDSLPAVVHQYSNQHEMFVFNSDTVGLGEEYTYGVLAHEFQHMIHWYHDRNEESWLNEGFAELSVFLNGYGTGFKDFEFMSNPNIQLTDWPTDFEDTMPHYGASFLFVTYFLDRFGTEATQALVAEAENGMDSVDKVLADHNIRDGITGEPITANQVFLDWVTANLLKDDRVADGRFTYHNYEDAPQVFDAEPVTNCSNESVNDQVRQYAARYYNLSCDGEVTLSFNGNTEVRLLPEDANSGKFAFWSNKGDESDMMLTQTFDLTNVSGPVEMSYQTWYDLEKDYDFAYVEASLDGESWQILKTPGGTSNNISGNNYGWGYNGETQGWVQETVDLSEFAGKKVTLRFEYVTDAAVNGEGMLLDDISIPAIDYSTDFETDDGGWQAEGFVRVENRLPQTFAVRLVKHLSDGTSEIEDVVLDENQAGQVKLNFAQGIDNVDLIISGLTRFTRMPGSFDFSLE